MTQRWTQYQLMTLAMSTSALPAGSVPVHRCIRRSSRLEPGDPLALRADGDATRSNLAATWSDAQQRPSSWRLNQRAARSPASSRDILETEPAYMDAVKREQWEVVVPICLRQAEGLSVAPRPRKDTKATDQRSSASARRRSGYEGARVEVPEERTRRAFGLARSQSPQASSAGSPPSASSPGLWNRCMRGWAYRR